MGWAVLGDRGALGSRRDKDRRKDAK